MHGTRFSPSEKLRDLWYGLAARRTVRKTSKTSKTRKNTYTGKNMRHVSGIVDSMRAFPFINVRGSGAHPVYIKVCYTVDYTVYYKREVFLSDGEYPSEGTRMTVVYPKDDPKKATLIY